MSLSLDPDDRRVPGSLSPELQAVAEITATVDGFLFPREGPLLYDLATACTGRGVIVEVGSWKGKSAIWLARGSESGRRPSVIRRFG
jgi:predicted O-methyltransferase YrrM